MLKSREYPESLVCEILSSIRAEHPRSSATAADVLVCLQSLASFGSRLCLLTDKEL